MNLKNIFLIIFVLIFLANPVLGYSEVDDPKDYRLTEAPSGYVISSEGHSTNENWKYYQHFNSGDNHLSVTIYSLTNDKISLASLETLKGNSGRSNEFYYSEITEIYGIGDKAYRITNIDFSDDSKTERLYFSKNHILIAVNFGDASELMKFAKLYENKITSVLDNAPQMFATIELEKGDNSIYYVGEDVIYYLTLSEGAHVKIEGHINGKKEGEINEFYKKGQYTLSLGYVIPPLGDEKLILTATSLKGSEAISTVSFISKEKVVTSTPTIDSIQTYTPNAFPSKTNYNDSSVYRSIIFILMLIVVILFISYKKLKK